MRSTEPPSGPGIVVVRLGPLATDLAPWRDRVASEMAELARRGRPVVAVHGGGPRVDATLAELGRRPAFVEGRAAPSPESLAAAATAALAVGKDLAAVVQQFGGRALGLSARDAGLELGGGQAVVDAARLRDLLADGFLPIVAAVGADAAGGAPPATEDAAAQVAAALGAELLVVLGLADGVELHGHRLPRVGSRRARLLVHQGEVAGPAAAGLAACARAVEGGCAQARVVDVRTPGGLLRAARGDDVGTLVVAQDVRAAARAAMQA